MFDIYCPHCGEPTEQDYLHMPEDLGGPDNLTYTEAAAAFKVNGCGLFTTEPTPCTRAPIEPPQRMAAIRAMQSFSDHPDEWALLF
jgi:hypothetical protein